MPRRKVTTQLIEQYLERSGWSKHQTDAQPSESQGVVLTGWMSPLSPEGQLLSIDPVVEKHGLVFRAPQIAMAPPDATPADRLSALLLTIGSINYRVVMGAFAFDPTDGELVFHLGIPIDSDDLRHEDFDHCLRAVQTSVDDHAADLRGLIDGTKSLSDVLRL